MASTFPEKLVESLKTEIRILRECIQEMQKENDRLQEIITKERDDRDYRRWEDAHRHGY